MAAYSEQELPLEVKLQAHLMEVESAFEASSETGVNKFIDIINELTHGENSDPELAAQIAEKIADKEYAVPEELQNQFKAKIGEGLLYGGNIDNERFERSAEFYDSVRKRTAEKLPQNINDIPEDERPVELGENFHSIDRLADLAFLSGNFEDAKNAYQHAFEARGKFKEIEKGPSACAKYGEAASAFMQGEIQTCLELIADAKNLLSGLEDNESILYPNIEKLEAAAMAFDGLDETEKPTRLEAIKESLGRNGGKQGGVKRINFEELYDEAGLTEPNPES
ncbi:MAG: hypothetical protein WCT08_05335 [Patescibacteria group bacterium]|jgi:hypothetical protein